MKRTSLLVLAGLMVAGALFGCKGGDAPAATAGDSGAPKATGGSSAPATTAALTVEEYQAKVESMEKAMNAEMETHNADMAEAQKNAADPAKKAEAMNKIAEIFTKVKDKAATLIAEMSAVNPPAELKEFHEISKESSGQLMTSMGAMIDAFKTGDEAKVKEATESMGKLQMEGEEKRMKALEAAGFDVEAYKKDKKLVKKAK
ncbi:MAG: hypothetical protein JST35_10490 [Armatimonadetes bacterium]|nr:hypothetical protein [Armatimonadota bacterium]